MNSKLPTISFGIVVACTFSDNLSRNSCISNAYCAINPIFFFIFSSNHREALKTLFFCTGVDRKNMLLVEDVMSQRSVQHSRINVSWLSVFSRTLRLLTQTYQLQWNVPQTITFSPVWAESAKRNAELRTVVCSNVHRSSESACWLNADRWALHFLYKSNLRVEDKLYLLNTFLARNRIFIITPRLRIGAQLLGLSLLA